MKLYKYLFFFFFIKSETKNWTNALRRRKAKITSTYHTQEPYLAAFSDFRQMLSSNRLLQHLIKSLKVLKWNTKLIKIPVLCFKEDICALVVLYMERYNSILSLRAIAFGLYSDSIHYLNFPTLNVHRETTRANRTNLRRQKILT